MTLQYPHQPGIFKNFDPWKGYCQGLREKVDINAIQSAVSNGKLKVFADVMYGAASGGLGRILDCPIQELHSKRDPLFGGGAPEPLPRYLDDLFAAIKGSDGEAVESGLGL